MYLMYVNVHYVFLGRCVKSYVRSVISPWSRTFTSHIIVYVYQARSCLPRQIFRIHQTV